MASRAARRRAIVRLGFIAAAALLLSILTAAPYLTRLGEDLLLPLASRLPADRPPVKVALIVEDEVTHRTPPFSETPDVAWTPKLARVLDAVGKAGPQVIGLDVVYPKTLAGPDLLPGFDRPFLTTLASLGRTGRLVLSEARLSDETITPYQGQVIAVGGADNLSPVTFQPDFDGVVRRYPTLARQENASPVRTFGAELAKRAGRTAKGAFLIDFRRPAAEFPVYRLSDLHRCLERDDQAPFEAFRGQVVIVGTSLDVEDRHLAANRFSPARTLQVTQTGCSPPVSVGRAVRQTSPGVLIQAYAVDTLINDTAPRSLPPILDGVLAFVLFAILGLVFLRLPPLRGAAVGAALAAIGYLASVFALNAGMLLPWLQWSGGGALLFAAVYGYRMIIEDRAKRQITHAFGRYLSPTLVDELADDPSRLKLGGENRKVAILFADVEGYTTFSERHAAEPEKIVDRLNALFSRIGDIVEDHGGYVDKFMGDAVMATWGAPGDAAEAEASAARAALAIVAAVKAHGAEDAQPGDAPFRVRIGVSCGIVLAGNLGSKRRFNYTVIGEAVNRASRLEDACKAYGADILADGAFVSALPPDIPRRQVAQVALRGTMHVIDIYALAAGLES